MNSAEFMKSYKHGLLFLRIYAFIILCIFFSTAKNRIIPRIPADITSPKKTVSA